MCDVLDDCDVCKVCDVLDDCDVCKVCDVLDTVMSVKCVMCLIL